MSPNGTTDACALHPHVSQHRPIPLAWNDHHVIPQAWQAAFNPNPSIGVLPQPERLDGKLGVKTIWDPRVAHICPTGHWNVHYWLEMIMHAVAGIPQNPMQDAAPGLNLGLDPISDIERLQIAVDSIKQQHHGRVTVEFGMALLAPSRWIQDGLPLQGLIDKGLWGEI